MITMFNAFFRMLTELFTGTEALAQGYSSVCRTTRDKATVYEKRCKLQSSAELQTLEAELNKLLPAPTE